MANKPTLVLFGATGQLGGAMAHRWASEARAVVAVPWSQARTWLDRADTTGWPADLVNERLNGQVDVVFANGNTDPAADPVVLGRDNEEFPIRVIERTAHRTNLRYLTLGTVLEEFPGVPDCNAYAASKKRLGDWVVTNAKDALVGRLAHVRLHTLYGGDYAHPHMFLGQMVAALRARRRFEMSGGQQLREYQHVEDVASALMRLLDRDAPLPSAMTLSTGRAVTLGALAKGVFAQLDRFDDLDLGAVAMNQPENFGHHFPPSDTNLIEGFRNPLEGVVAWVNTQVG